MDIFNIWRVVLGLSSASGFIQIFQVLEHVPMLKCNLEHYHFELLSSRLSERPVEHRLELG